MGKICQLPQCQAIVKYASGAFGYFICAALHSLRTVGDRRPWSPSMRRQDLIFDAPTLTLLADIGVALRCVLHTNTSQMAPMHADHQSINAKFFEARK
ncbi:hypothetical protein B0H13DRAFT_2038470 [Mycena leptocephala]|nr:hypothetical protein B0H13DRAFT_2038470 [Mycena leptocephala]